MKYILENDKCYIEYDDSATSATDYFTGSDKTDKANSPQFYSKTCRSHKKAFKALKTAFDADMTMFKACYILEDNGIRTHAFCAWD